MSKYFIIIKRTYFKEYNAQVRFNIKFKIFRKILIKYNAFF